MLGDADTIQKDHWFIVGERTAVRVHENNSKNTAEQEANMKSLFGKVRTQFIAGFKLKMVELTGVAS